MRTISELWITAGATWVCEEVQQTCNIFNIYRMEVGAPKTYFIPQNITYSRTMLGKCTGCKMWSQVLE